MPKKIYIRPVSIILGVTLAIGLALVPLWLEVRSRRISARETMSSVPPSVNFRSKEPSPTPVESLISIKDILTLSRQYRVSRVNQYPLNETSQVVLTGDVMLGRAVNYNMTRKQDYTIPFSKVAEVLRQADIAMVNLEAQVFPSCPLVGEGMQLCGNTMAFSAIQDTGLDVAQLANNHAFDYGREALEYSQAWLAQSGVDSTGLGKAAIKQVRDTKFGFLGYNQVGSLPAPVEKANPAKLQQDISELKAEADVIIVGFHWGVEYSSRPTPEQVSLAKAAIDAGADVVVGHHPHWVQGVQIYRDKPIFYSLGNFVFDQMQSRETREGIAVKLEFWKDQLIEAQILPIYMNDFATPEWQPVGVGNSTLGKIERLSQELH